MNTHTDLGSVPAERPRPTPHPTHRLTLLLKREFWEHKGGFLWAPVWAGAISLILTLMGMILGEVALRRNIGDGVVKVDGQVMINGLDLGQITSRMDAAAIRQLAGGIDLSLLMAALWPLIVLGFVVFFYALGCLYDERKDRSVLFWKSLPVSDRETVAAKALSALLVAPTLAVDAAIATLFGFLLLLSLFVLLHHGNPVALLWGPGSPLKVAALLLAQIPLYAAWALPSVGWLMLCSVWARSKPFLWATLLPVFSGIVVSWFGLMNLFQLDSGWYWKHIVARGLLSAFPGSWNLHPAVRNGVDVNTPSDLLDVLHPAHSWALFGTTELWIGALAGLAMLLLAIRLRRWRDDN